MRFREADRMLKDDGWVRVRYKRLTLPIQTPNKARKSKRSESSR